MSLLSNPRAIRYSTVMERSVLRQGFRLSPGPIADALNNDAQAARDAAHGLWQRDVAVWSRDPAARRSIASRLGGLASPSLMETSLARFAAVADEVRGRFDAVVLLGMGGSSLAPEVLRAVIGVSEGWPQFHMLDSTDPASVQSISTDPGRT